MNYPGLAEQAKVDKLKQLIGGCVPASFSAMLVMFLCNMTVCSLNKNRLQKRSVQRSCDWMLHSFLNLMIVTVIYLFIHSHTFKRMDKHPQK